MKTSEPILYPLAAILEDYVPVYPHENPTWDANFKFMDNEPYDLAVVEELVRQAKRDGQFKEPVYLETWASRHYDDVESEDDEDEDVRPPSKLRVLNGTHRVVAAYRAGLSHVLATFDIPPTPEDDDEAGEYDAQDYFETDVMFLDPIQTTYEDDDEFDEFFSRVRSFPVDDDTWVVADMISTNDGGLHASIYWDAPVPDASEAREAIVKRIDEILYERLRTFRSYVVLNTRVETFTENDERGAW